MRRKTAVLALLLISIAAIAAAQHGRAAAPMPMPGPDPNIMIIGANATVSGVVTSVSGSIVSLANGLITLDVTNAKYVYDRGPEAPLAPGILISAVVDNGTKANAPLHATLIFVTTLSQVTLNGPVTSADVAHSTITLLSHTIDVNFQTKFNPPLTDGHATGLADIKPAQLVTVTAGASGSTLLASSIAVTQLFLPPTTLIHGTVKSIGTDTWVITTSTGDVTISVPPHTPMLAEIKVGDTVDVVVRTDASGAYVAILIVKTSVMMH